MQKKNGKIAFHSRSSLCAMPQALFPHMLTPIEVNFSFRRFALCQVARQVSCDAPNALPFSLLSLHHPTFAILILSLQFHDLWLRPVRNSLPDFSKANHLLMGKMSWNWSSVQSSLTLPELRIYRPWQAAVCEPRRFDVWGRPRRVQLAWKLGLIRGNYLSPNLQLA